MEENEDAPADVRLATPVEDEIKKAEEPPKGSNKLQKKGVKGDTKKRKKEDKDEDCCENKKRMKKENESQWGTIHVFEKECKLPKLNIVPRHCLSKKEHLDMLATPSRKCESQCLKKSVTRKLKPIPPRIEELARPPTSRILRTIEDRGDTLTPEILDNLIKMVEATISMSPEQAAQLFHDKKSRSTKKCKKKKNKIKCNSKKEKRKENGDKPLFDPEAVCCQYLMAERFVKSILDWNCPIPKEEYRDIAEVIIRRLSYILEYTPIDNGDRISQQMRFLADLISCWISGVLLEVAEDHRKELEEECKRRKQEEEEETEEEEEEEEDEKTITPKSESEVEEEEDDEEKGKEGEKEVEEQEPEIKSVEEDGEKAEEEEIERKRAEEEEAERKRVEEEEAERKRLEEEEAEKIRLEQEEAERKRLEEEEAEKIRLEQEEAERKRAEEEEAERKRVEEEEAERKRLEEEEAERKRLEEEEAERKRLEEEEAEKIRLEQEEAERKRLEEEEAERIRLEEEAAEAKRLDEERLRLEEEAAERKIAEEQAEKIQDKPAIIDDSGVPMDIPIAKTKEFIPIQIGSPIKVFQSDLPFVTFIKIFNTIYTMIEKEKENSGHDVVINRLHRAVYEKFYNAVLAENPNLLSDHAKDVIDVMSGKIAAWLSKILSESQVLLLEKYPPEVESKEVRDWSNWIDYTTATAGNWSVWLQRLIKDVQKMQDDKVTRGQWEDFTQHLHVNAFLWRRFHLDTVHKAHHNVMMIKDREVVKTGEKKIPDYPEKELNVFNLE